MAAFGFVSFLLVHFGAQFIEDAVLKNPGTSLSLQAIAPSLFFVPVMSAYRGYFQGRQNMNPTALSQFFEQLFRVIVGLVLAYYLIPTGLEATNAGATFGCTAGAVAGLVVIIAIYLLNLPSIRTKIRRNRSHERLESTRAIVKRLLLLQFRLRLELRFCLSWKLSTAQSSCVGFRRADGVLLSPKFCGEGSEDTAIL